MFSTTLPTAGLAGRGGGLGEDVHELASIRSRRRAAAGSRCRFA